MEAPLNVGMFLMNAARDYWYTHDAKGFERQRPILERMLNYVLKRYEYGKSRFEKSDRRYGLIWGSPEADLGDTANDYPDAHPLYYQNAAGVWRGLEQYSRALISLGAATKDASTTTAGESYGALAKEMRENIQSRLRQRSPLQHPSCARPALFPLSQTILLENQLIY